MYKPHTIEQYKVYRFLEENFALEHFLLAPLSRFGLMLEDKTGEKIAFNVQLPALINTLKDIAAALSRPAPSAISFPADPRFLTSLYYGEYEADVFKLDKRLTPFNQAVQQKEKALLPLLSNEASIAFEQYQTAVQCRNSAVLEQAYASGYRTAVQMFAAGLGPQPPIPEHEEDSNG